MSGLYGKKVSVEDQTIEVCEIPEVATINIEAVNCSQHPAYVNIAISKRSTPIAEDFIEHSLYLKGTGVLIRSAIVVSPNEKIFIYSTNSNCSVRVHGISGSV